MRVGTTRNPSKMLIYPTRATKLNFAQLSRFFSKQTLTWFAWWTSVECRSKSRRAGFLVWCKKHWWCNFAFLLKSRANVVLMCHEIALERANRTGKRERARKKKSLRRDTDDESGWTWRTKKLTTKLNLIDKRFLANLEKENQSKREVWLVRNQLMLARRWFLAHRQPTTRSACPMISFYHHIFSDRRHCCDMRDFL